MATKTQRAVKGSSMTVQSASGEMHAWREAEGRKYGAISALAVPLFSGILTAAILTEAYAENFVSSSDATAEQKAENDKLAKAFRQALNMACRRLYDAEQRAAGRVNYPAYSLRMVKDTEMLTWGPALAEGGATHGAGSRHRKGASTVAQSAAGAGTASTLGTLTQEVQDEGIGAANKVILTLDTMFRTLQDSDRSQFAQRIIGTLNAAGFDILALMNETRVKAGVSPLKLAA